MTSIRCPNCGGYRLASQSECPNRYCPGRTQPGVASGCSTSEYLAQVAAINERRRAAEEARRKDFEERLRMMRTEVQSETCQLETRLASLREQQIVLLRHIKHLEGQRGWPAFMKTIVAQLKKCDDDLARIESNITPRRAGDPVYPRLRCRQARAEALSVWR
jgi:hypothetical protein